MKNFQLFSFLSLALATLIGAGCAPSTPPAVSASPSTEDETTTQATTDAVIDAEIAVDMSTSIEVPTTNSNTAPAEDTSVYIDGTYTATGTYTSPGGKESLPVTLTLEGDVIVDVSVQTPATNPTSQKFQTIFADNFTPLVVGKNIDDLNLTKVSGSSLTPAGFNDALAQIKVAAQN